MNAEERRLVNLGFNAGWDAHEAYIDPAHTAALMEAWDQGFTACGQQFAAQRKDSDHPITRENPHFGGAA